MKLRELALKQVKGNELECGYLEQDYKEYGFENIPNGKVVNITFYEEEEMVNFKGKIIDRKIAEFGGEEEKSFIVKNEEGEKILIAISEIDSIIRDFAKENFEELFQIEKYVEDNLKQLEQLENFDFLTNTKYGIEIEGGWNGSLNLDNFRRTTDNSFELPNKEVNDEFYYDGCASANEMLSDLFNNYGELNSHNFEYIRTTGTHIHLSQFGKSHKTFNKEDLLKVVSFLVSVEDVILDIIPSPRVGTIDKLNGEIFSKKGGYSKSVYHRKQNFLNTIEEIKFRLTNEEMTDTLLDRLINKLEENWYGKHTVDKNSKYNITRYYGINLHSYFTNGSLELRHFEGNYRNIIYYIDVIDKIMYLIENLDWVKIQTLLDKLDSYKKVSTKSNALLFALGVSNKTLSKLLSRTDYSQLNIIKNHSLLKDIRGNVTNEKAELDIPVDYKEKNINDVTCFPENIDRNADYTKNKYKILDKIKDKKGNLRKDFGEIITEHFTGQDKDEFLEYIDEVSQNIERGDL